MKITNLFVSSILCLSLLINCIPWNMSDKLDLEDTNVSLSDYSDRDYEDNSIIVCMEKGKSPINTVYSPEDFPDLNVDYIEDLTYTTNEELLNDEEYQSNFTQILQIHLKNNSTARSVEASQQAVLDAVASVSKSKDVPIAYVSPNYVSEFTTNSVEPNDTFYTSDQKLIMDTMEFPMAWRLTTGSDTIKVAVIDGYVKNHPDLVDNLGTGYDAYNLNNDTYSGFDNHGTAVAGVLGAVGNNSMGISGACWNIEIVPIRVFSREVYLPDSYSYEVDNASFVRAITYLNNNKIFITNMSMGTTTYDSIYETAINNYYGLFVVAAGNLGQAFRPTYMEYPACCNCDNIITVAGTNVTETGETLYALTNRGIDYVDIAAPAFGIYTTNYDKYEDTYGYIAAEGTSVAAPFVAGTAALVKSLRNELSATEIKSIILSTVDQLDILTDVCSTGGRLNAKNAVFGALSYSRRNTPSFSGDVNGDGLDDIIHYRNLNGKRQFMTFISGTVAYNAYPLITLTDDSFSIDDTPFIGDFNGDGKTDILIHSIDDSGYRQVHIYCGNSDGKFNTAILTYSDLFYSDTCDDEKLFIVDVYGDGKDDLVISYYNTDSKFTTAIMYGRASASLSPGTIITTDISKPSSTVYETILTGDVNGDGCDDLIQYRSSESSYAHLIRVFNGGTPAYSTSKLTVVNFGSTTNQFIPYVCELNGDSKSDLLIAWEDSNGYFNFRTAYAGVDSSYTFNSNILTSHLYDDIINLYMMDTNADGFDDLVLQIEGDEYCVLYTYLTGSAGVSNTCSTFTTSVPCDAYKFTVGKFFEYGRESLVAEWCERTGGNAYYQKIQHQYTNANGTFSKFPVVQTGIGYYYLYK